MSRVFFRQKLGLRQTFKIEKISLFMSNRSFNMYVRKFCNQYLRINRNIRLPVTMTEMRCSVVGEQVGVVSSDCSMLSKSKHQTLKGLKVQISHCTETNLVALRRTRRGPQALAQVPGTSGGLHCCLLGICTQHRSRPEVAFSVYLTFPFRFHFTSLDSLVFVFL